MMPLTVQVLAPFSKIEKEESMIETMEEKEMARKTRQKKTLISAAFLEYWSLVILRSSLLFPRIM
jgi:hypothetical protein